MNKKTALCKIAVLGASSHIAKGLIYHFSREGHKNIDLYARSKNKLESFLKQINCPGAYPKKDFADLSKHRYGAVINCVGLGTPAKVKKTGKDIFKLTEEFDNMVLEYLKKHPRAVYINFSSGAVYNIRVNDDIAPEDYYGIAKLHQEAKHRALNKFNIVDIRLFSYFSRFIDLDSGYFLTELLKSLKDRKVFTADHRDFTRDFISPRDLFNLVCLIINKPFNGAIDAYSSAPAGKIKLLKYFAKNHSLKYTFKNNLKLICPTGVKKSYCPKFKKAAGLGYNPKDSSMETVAEEAEYILKK